MSEILAISSAFFSALGSMFINELKERVPLLQLCRWQWVTALMITGAISLILGGWRTIGLRQAGLLFASGFFGIAIASTTYNATIHAVGPRINALLYSLAAPFALGLAYLVLGEAVTGAQAGGIALVLCGVVLAIGMPQQMLTRDAGATSLKVTPAATISIAPTSNPPVTRVLARGIALGLVTAFGQALGVLFAKPVMASHIDPFTAMALRLAVATAFVTLALIAAPRFRVRKRGSDLRAIGIAASSAFFGTVLGASLLLAALHKGNVGIVTTLSSITPLLILPMVWIRDGEMPPRPAWIGGILVIAGTTLISQ